ncbi:hypothetical protein G7Z17_g11529 [Cylindrodendrum hubeiense]|uniref:Uncharacterized protein n=1 Tax=Cylindrodendrum hubeiense TaxID=595255 RepID=A0A9P5H4W6_9HYPO|nr:hypothetical protein G7Z17_g11529 [Cylindrodendrum hubeiense]
MNATKRCAQEISSADDANPIDEVTPPLRKAPRRYGSPSSQSTMRDGNNSPREQSFAEFLANTVPVALIDPEVLEFLVYQSNVRLNLAKREGISITEISIGDDCLPVWPGFTWDPAVESLHSAIQHRLADLEIAQGLGNLVRNDVIYKGNRKLNEARQSGVQLEGIVIGNGLLPVWGDDTVQHQGSEHGGSEVDELSHITNNLCLSTSSTCVESASDATMATLVDSEASRSPVVLTSPGSFDSDSSDSDSDSGFDSDAENIPPRQEDNGIFAIPLNNHVHDQVYYSEDDDALNVVHDVEVIGSPRGRSIVDLEVFVADDDDEVYDLPEMELVIDREGFEYWHNTDEAIDIEVPGTELRCTGEIISIEEVDDEEAARVIAANAKANIFFNPIPIIEEPDETDDLVSSPLRDHACLSRTASVTR